MSTDSQPKTTSVKTYSEAVSASEGTRSEPSKPIDKDSISHLTFKKVDKESLATSPSSNPTMSNIDQTKPTTYSKEISASKGTLIGSTRIIKLNDPVPSVGPFKSREKVLRLIANTSSQDRSCD
ncbi:hypothetical protein PGT21_008310 [Puccinia graminis f. sp. tritici]|uniref:Uncharacterized protein n=1 Tax=Puccinia graminis f. sp. tritici TaxID=56615 RepID=A0A5B0PCZ9_PUCGR|nr:hypothetical protein PGTUg99_024876 [Puccinia graminis f. sp. tritici]KAA1084779.1 hypothetical protein PGT21_035312 [Puccinia graminis f. sp. tritici]KAA1099467.1 hypothetical protein PGT21_008310 [Puccinia graminis f. sp. tritici]KAA1123266.1 hypothetical protein PGTUg99_017736 [Puccinia graminis f. sp. tritici]